MRSKVRLIAMVCIVSLSFLVIPQGGIISPNIAQAQEEEEEAFKVDGISLAIGAILGWFIHQWLGKPAKQTVERPEGVREEKLTEGVSVESEEALLPQSFTIENLWKVTVTSIGFLSGTRNLELNLLIENLQNEPAECKIYTHEAKWGGAVKETYLLDNLGNEYQVSTNPLEEQKRLIPYMPLETQLIFPELKEKAKAIALYLTFTGKNLETDKWHYKKLYIGPIKIPSESYYGE